MPKAVSRHRKLDRNQWIAFCVLQLSIMGIVELRSARQDLVHSFLADGQRKKFMNDNPLVMPADKALRHLEYLLGREITEALFGAQVIDDRVVKPQHGQMQLTDDDVLIVPAVADNGGIVDVARNIVADRSFAGHSFRTGNGLYLELNVAGALIVKLRRP